MTTNFHQVAPGRRAAVALDTITASRQDWQRTQRRPRALTAREALAAVQFECLLLWTAMANARAGIALSDAEFDRLTVAMSRIDAICDEVNA